MCSVWLIESTYILIYFLIPLKYNFPTQDIFYIFFFF